MQQQKQKFSLLRARWCLALALLWLAQVECRTRISGTKSKPKQKPTTYEDSGELRHVSKCNFCAKCQVTTDAAQQADKMKKDGLEDSLEDGHAVWRSMIDAHAFPTDHELFLRWQLPNCTQCYGCTTELKQLHQAAFPTFGNKTYNTPKGLSSAWLFLAPSNQTHDGKAVVRVLGIPYNKLTFRLTNHTHHPDRVAEDFQRQLAIARIEEDCGMQGLNVKTWVENVTAVIPELGFKIDWPAMWMERARGVALETLIQHVPAGQLQELLVKKLNKTKLISAAVFDLLVSHTDRNLKNIYITEDGNFQMLDNEDCLAAPKHNAHLYVLNSILLPSTWYNEEARFGKNWIHYKEVPYFPPPSWEFPAMLLDYRCANRGELKTRYPPVIAKCLKKIAGMSVAAVQERYELPTRADAQILQIRAKDMITKGFEWTLQYGKPDKPESRKFVMQPPCCSITWVPPEPGTEDPQGHYICGDKGWRPSKQLPKPLVDTRKGDDDDNDE